MVKSGSGHQARSKATQLSSPHGAKSSLSNRQWLSPGAPAEEQSLVVPDPGAGEAAVCLRSKGPIQRSAGLPSEQLTVSLPPGPGQAACLAQCWIHCEGQTVITPVPRGL